MKETIVYSSETLTQAASQLPKELEFNEVVSVLLTAFPAQVVAKWIDIQASLPIDDKGEDEP